MNPHETAHVFQGPGEPLIGVLSHPATPATMAVVIVVGGPQYRVGSHRQFVSLARRVAEAGHAALRFDYRGMGDSAGNVRSFDTVSDDIGCAIDFLWKELPTLRGVVLWGLCDGASAALIYCKEQDDRRVAGLALANPWVRSEQTLARTHVKHYYLQRLMAPAFWRKLLSGGVGTSAVQGWLRAIRTSRSASASTPSDNRPFQTRMAEAWRDPSRRMLLLLSGRDYTAKEFVETVNTDPAWRGALDRPNLSRQVLEAADHTFSGLSDQRAMEALTCDWLQSLSLAWTPASVERERS